MQAPLGYTGGMPQVRKAHSVEIIDRRLRDAEAGIGDDATAMGLVGLHDELARVERKWREKAAGTRPNGRPLADAAAIDGRFERLGRLVAAALRRGDGTADERALLEPVDRRLRDRQPLRP